MTRTTYTYGRHYTARLGDKIVTIPDQIAANQRQHDRAETAFFAYTDRGERVRVRLDGNAYGLHTSGTGDVKVRRASHPATKTSDLSEDDAQWVSAE